jgi:TRAP-type C4-dicarboxylate transport system substrate-binding protein
MTAFRRFAMLAAAVLLGCAHLAASAQTTLTMSSWVGPNHLLTRDVLQAWATSVEKATHGRVKFQMLAKHPSSPPGTFDAVRDDLVDVSYVTASYTPARHPVTQPRATISTQFGLRPTAHSPRFARLPLPASIA